MKKIFAISIIFNIIILNNLFCFAQITSKNNRYFPIDNYFLNEDKYENFNRKIFNANLKLNKYIVKKIHTLWASIIPSFLITGFNNIYTNIEYPKRLISCTLQHDKDGIIHETKRFIINTTIGLVGLIDVANKYFNLELYNEDMEQALAKCKIKCGNYLVVPILSSTSTRDIMGRILDFLLNPTTYFSTPITALVKMGFLINRTANIQPIIKMMETNFADPYTVTKKFYSANKYIKQSNYDRKNVIENIKDDYDDKIELVDNKNKKESLQVSGEIKKTENIVVFEKKDEKLNADIVLNDYNPQNPILDSMRTALLLLRENKKSFWNELSIWNRSFNKKLKTANIKYQDNRQNYKFKYILQKEKISPLAIIFPSIGEGIDATHSSIIGKIFYDEGYSVIIVGSHFNFEFLKSIEKNYYVGNIKQDVKHINKLLNKIVDNVSEKNNRLFTTRTVFGTSLGAYTALYLANEQYEIGAKNIDKFISVCPPNELFYAITKIDSIIEAWKDYPDDIKNKMAISLAKVLRAFNHKEDFNKNMNNLPFSNYEAKLISGFVFHQKISDLIYTIEKEKNPNIDNKKLYEKIYNSNYEDYIKQYLLTSHEEEIALINESTLKSISNYLINNDNYIIFHSLDDYLTNKSQLKELKGFCDDKLVLFNNGAHLGFLYRDEFINALKNEIKLTNVTANR